MINPILLFRKEIELLTGWSSNKARDVIKYVWKQKGMAKQRWISLSDFCYYYHMHEETMLKVLEKHYKG